jgi:hypothetical protein
MLHDVCPRLCAAVSASPMNDKTSERAVIGRAGRGRFQMHRSPRPKSGPSSR